MASDHPPRLLSEFFSAIFHPDDLVEVRVLGGQKWQEWRPAASLTDPEFIARLTAANAAGANVYFGVNPRARRGGKAEDVALARALVVDFDGGVTPPEALPFIEEAGLPAPTVVVFSGHGTHCYWLLDEAITDLALWTRHQKGLIRALGTDACIHDPPRIMRMPGFLNQKTPPGVMAEVVECHPERVYAASAFPQREEVERFTALPGETVALDPGQRPELSPTTKAFLAGGAPFGRRNADLFKAACDMAGCGYPQPEAEAALIPVAVASPGDHPFTDEEGRDTVARAYAKPRSPTVTPELTDEQYANPHGDIGPDARVHTATSQIMNPTGSLPPDSWRTPAPLIQSVSTMPFPIDTAFNASMSDIRDFVAGLAHELQVPVDLPAMLLLPIVTAAIAKKFTIEARPGWRENGALWTLSILDSGERKSGTFRRMTDPILEWEKEEAERLAEDIATVNERRQILEQQRLNARRKAGRGDAEAQREAIELAKQLEAEKEIVPPTLVTSDATSEALVGLMMSNGERALVASPEADAMDVLMGRYDEKARPNMGVWLKGYSGDRVRVHRRGRGPEFMERPSLSVALAVQPEAVRGLFSNRAAHGRGLLARFFTSVPQGMVGRRIIGAPPTDERLEMAYVNTIRRLLNIPLDAEMGPRVVRLSPEAAEMFRQFEEMIEKELGKGGFLADQKTWGAKLCGGILRIALVLHVLDLHGGGCARSAGSAQEVNGENMKAALAWAPYLIEHERLAAQLAGCDLDVAIAERVLGWIRRGGRTSFTKRDCFSECRGLHVNHTEDVDGALRVLEEFGYIRGLAPPAPAGKQGGRPASPRFIVNPLWAEGGYP